MSVVLASGVAPLPNAKGASVLWSVEQIEGGPVAILASAHAVVRVVPGESLSDEALRALYGGVSAAPVLGNAKLAARALAAAREVLERPLDALVESRSAAFERAREQMMLDRQARLHQQWVDERASRRSERPVGPSFETAVAEIVEAGRESVFAAAEAVVLEELPAVPAVPGVRVVEPLEGVRLLISEESARRGATILVCMRAGVVGSSESVRMLLDVDQDEVLAELCESLAAERGLEFGEVARMLLVSLAEVGVALGRGRRAS